MAKASIKISMVSGKVVLNRDNLAQLFRNLKDGDYIVKIEGLYKWKGRYRFYRGVLIEYILQALKLNASNDALHDYCKQLFCANPIVNPMTGEILVLTGGTTTALSDDDFVEYMEKIRAHFAMEYEVEFTI